MSTKKKPNSGNPAKKPELPEAAGDQEPETGGRLMAIPYAGETWVIDPKVIESPELLYLLAEMQGYAEDEDSVAADVSGALTSAMDAIRLLFGRQQGRRFARAAADLDQLGTRLREFFQAASAQAGRPDPTGGPGSSGSTEVSATPPSAAATA